MSLIGTLDRSGTIYSTANAPGTGGANVLQLTSLGTMYFRRVKIDARTMIAGGRDAIDTEDIFVCRYLLGLKPGWQVNIEGTQYRITGARELGRREGWQIFCRAIT